MTEVKRYTFDARAGTLTRYEDGTLIVRANSELVPADDYDMLVVQFNELVAQADKYIVAGQDDKARIATLEALLRRQLWTGEVSMDDPRLDVESLRAIRQREAETVPLSTNPAELDRRRLLVHVDALAAELAVEQKSNAYLNNLHKSDKSRIRELEAALRKYGSHDDDCPGGFKNMACTCGWGQARAALAPKEPT